MKKPKRSKRPKAKRPKVKRVKLTPDAVVEIVAPKAYVPIAVPAADGVLKIAPVPAAKVKDVGWFRRVFG